MNKIRRGDNESVPGIDDGGDHLLNTFAHT